MNCVLCHCVWWSKIKLRIERNVFLQLHWNCFIFHQTHSLFSIVYHHCTLLSKHFHVRVSLRHSMNTLIWWAFCYSKYMRMTILKHDKRLKVNIPMDNPEHRFALVPILNKGVRAPSLFLAMTPLCYKLIMPINFLEFFYYIKIIIDKLTVFIFCRNLFWKV